MLAILVRFIHIILIMFMVLAPFSNNFQIFLLHVMSSVTIFTHWYFNNDACFLTQVEAYLLKKSPENTFISSIVSPVYMIKNQEIYIGLGILTCISLYKIYVSRKLFSKLITYK